MGFRVYGLGFRIYRLGFTVASLSKDPSTVSGLAECSGTLNPKSIRKGFPGFLFVVFTSGHVLRSSIRLLGFRVYIGIRRYRALLSCAAVQRKLMHKRRKRTCDMRIVLHGRNSRGTQEFSHSGIVCHTGARFLKSGLAVSKVGSPRVHVLVPKTHE